MTYCKNQWKYGDPLMGNIPSGIYIIQHIKTGKAYIGLAQDILFRWRVHINKRSNNSYIGRALRKHGPQSFTFRVLEFAEPDRLSELEKKYIAAYGTLHPNGYNMTTGGEGNYDFSSATKEKMSEATRKAWEEGRLVNRWDKPESKELQRQSLQASWDANPIRREKLSKWNTERKIARIQAVEQFLAFNFDTAKRLSYKAAFALMTEEMKFTKRTLRDYIENHNRSKR